MTQIVSSEPGVVPAGIVFGSKVLVVPPLTGQFSHSGHLAGLTSAVNYRWVNRGEYVARFTISTPKIDLPLIKYFGGKQYHSSYFRSPVSGLILHPHYEHGFLELTEDPPTAGFAILMPNNEAPAEKGVYIFSQTCDLVRKSRELYMKDSRYWSMRAFSTEEIEEFLLKQEDCNCRVYEALPHWNDYFNEARMRHPDLRPHLRHLRQ